MSHPHHIVHIELSAADHKAAAQFYAEVFGWQTQEFAEMNYSTFAAEGGSPGGFNPVSDEYPAGSVTVYIGTPDLAASLEKVKANGGTVVMPFHEIPGVGTMATFKDPTGNLMALMQAAATE